MHFVFLIFVLILKLFDSGLFKKLCIVYFVRSKS